MSTRHTAFALLTGMLILLSACAGSQTPTSQPTSTTQATPISTNLPSATPLPTLTPLPNSPQTIRNVPYITDGDFKQKLDIYLPAGSDKAFPALFAIHGGGGDKNDFSRLAAYLVERGYALVSINYRERPQFKHPVPLKDAFCALAWVQTNADTYNLDTQRIFAVGHSIGGTLAAMLAVVDDPSEYMQDCPYTLEPRSLQGCVTYTGIFDYTAMDKDPNTSLRNYFAGYFGADLDEAPELWAQASPITWLDKGDPPFLLIHGLEDTNINPDYSTNFADKLRETGIGSELLLIPDMEHMSIIGSQKSFEAVEAFLANPPQPTTAIAPDDLSIDVPQAAPPKLDGTLSPGEWDGARQAQLSDGSELLLMHNEGYLYLGIRADAEGIGSICIEQDSQVAVLHSSASLGTAVYKQVQDGWERIRDFTWTCPSIYDNPEAQAEWAAHLEQDGWLASTVLRGNPTEMEFQIAMPKGSLRLAVTHLGTNDSNSIAWWPARLDDSCRSLRLVQGTALQKPNFSPQTWMTVTTASYVSATPTAALGDTWMRSADDEVMVYVPAGKFTMGIDREGVKFAQQMCKQYGGTDAIATCQATAFANEQPAHGVTLDGFWMDRTEVTNQQYRLCVDSGTCTPPVELGSYTRDSYYNDSAYDEYPVIWITQGQATTYCAWAGGRLPTEAEWEYAARGPQGWIYPWGNEFDGTRLNYCDASCAAAPKDEAVNDGYAETAPVGSFPSGISWCGALDLAGNVREWVADWYGDYPHKAEVNPTGPTSGDSRIPRGGCWLDTPDDARSTNRGANSVDYTRHKVGFRCVVDADAPALAKE